jgi:hypothetical protein
MRMESETKGQLGGCRKPVCEHCPTRTPFEPTESLRLAKELYFEEPLDEGIRDIVLVLIANGVETYESCEGGKGHAYPWPTVRFTGSPAEGLRAVSVALANGLPVAQLRRTWSIRDESIHGPWWEMTFKPSKDSPLWAERNISASRGGDSD